MGWLEARRTLGFVLLLVWAVYFTVIAAGNLSDLLWSFGWIDLDFRSGNLHWVTVSTSIYFDSRAADQVLLAGAIAFEATGAVLLWRAFIAWAKGAPTAQAAARAGLIVATSLWFVFAIITELTVSYERGNNESDYWVICASSLASLIVIDRLARDTADA